MSAEVVAGKKYKVLICDDLAEEGMKFLREAGNFDIVCKTKLPIEELKKQISDADACLVRSGTQLTAEIIAASTRLRVIGRAGVGLDNVDANAASKKGIIVMNTPDGNTISAAEHTFCLLMAMARNIPAANNSLKNGEWERKKFTGVELYDKTLGVLGLGRIGSEVTKRAQAFGMQVIAYDPYLHAEKAQKIGVEIVTLDDLASRSDFLTIHMPLTPETKYIIGEKFLSKMKKSARLINCARGGIIDEKALLNALDAGQVAGAALDVFESEPPKDFAIIKHPKVIVTPHLGASTEEAQIAVSVDVVKSVIDYFSGKGVRNAVNFPSIDPEVLLQLKPYVLLAEKIGALSSQLLDGQIQEVDIQFSGQVSEYQTTPISVALIKGLLTPILAENVNYVNASLLAKERGIRITESKTSTLTHYANLIQVSVKSDKKSIVIAGTVFTKEDTRIVKIDNFDVEIVPEGYTLYVSNKDVPGIVGQVGTILANNKINIAGMTLGRDVRGGQAKTMIRIDSEVSSSLLDEIKKSPNILDAKLIRF